MRGIISALAVSAALLGAAPAQAALVQVTLEGTILGVPEDQLGIFSSFSSTRVVSNFEFDTESSPIYTDTYSDTNGVVVRTSLEGPYFFTRSNVDFGGFEFDILRYGGVQLIERSGSSPEFGIFVDDTNGICCDNFIGFTASTRGNGLNLNFSNSFVFNTAEREVNIFFSIAIGGQLSQADAMVTRLTVIVDGMPIAPSVPEPSTWAMMLVGFAGLGYAARRRRQEKLAA